MAIKVHVLTQKIETIAIEAINDSFDPKDFKDNIGMAWAHDFKFLKRRFKKFYQNIAFPPCNLPDYTNVVVDYSEYKDKSNIERGETSSWLYFIAP